MSTVFQRTIRASPERLSSAVWSVISEMIAPDKSSQARRELDQVAGLAGTIISAKYPLDDGIIIFGGGPRVRFYCIYDDDAVSGEKAKESKLPSSPIEGEWQLSFPCAKEEIEWLRKALEGKPARFSLRALGEDVDGDEQAATSSKAQPANTVNLDAFLQS